MESRFHDHQGIAFPRCSGTTKAAVGYRSGKMQNKERTMPLLIPVLVGIPVVLGGGWIIYHWVH